MNGDATIIAGLVAVALAAALVVWVLAGITVDTVRRRHETGERRGF